MASGKQKNKNREGPQKKERNGLDTKSLFSGNRTKVMTVVVFTALILSTVLVYEFVLNKSDNGGNNVIDRSIVFPRDGGSHKEALEFWIFSAVIHDDGGNRFGYRVTYTNFGRRDAVFTDENNVTGRPYYFIRDNPTTEDPEMNIRASNSSLDITYTNFGVHDRWAESDTEMFTYNLSSGVNLQASKRMELNVTLVSNKKPLLLGDGGRVNLMEYGVIYAYMQSNLSVSGTMLLDGQEQLVRGFGRIEHAWGSQGLSSVETWNLMLSNGKELSTTRMYLPGSRAIFLQYDYLIDNDGDYDVTIYSDVMPIAPNFYYDDYRAQNLSIREKRYLMDPYDTTQARCYGYGWRFTSNRSMFDLNVDPAVAYQLNYEGYVGTVRTSGTFKGLPVTGYGHVNLLMAYDSTLRLIELSDNSEFNMKVEIPNDPVKVTVELEIGLPLDNALLHYRVNGGANQSIPLVLEEEEAGIWIATIPGQSLGTVVEYWIYVDNLAGKSIMTETVTYVVRIGG